MTPADRHTPIELRRQQLTRYILPLREGGSLPALAEADDGFNYAVKFGGGGHGTKALVAELIGGLIASALPLNVPEPVLLDLGEEFGRTEPDEEVQELLQNSRGLNLGMHFLAGAFTFDPTVDKADPLTASLIVWLDAFITNVDRTFRNTNMLTWHSGRELWLIDHGSALYFHHSWRDFDKMALSPFPYIKDHALIREASRLDEADVIARERITPELIESVVALLPDEWLAYDGAAMTPDEIRAVYARFLKLRLENHEIFLNHAKQSHAASQSV